MMKATPKFDEESQKWVINVEIEEGEVLPVGKTINDKMGIWETSKWNSKELAEKWVKAKPQILTLGY
ncbi:hypothetical protein [Clostridium botulinum]|uniref:hypothetical protein n=1 Tax=Clostridium botulinum TaxID=1491 RepID=UPI0004D6E640|nr:hypothetical protein [Clostridium botulinum]KEH99748.1 hypothetical protein Z952_p0072 [Clostridium botulinum C/D str. BKT75002]KEI05226.1 hypothetical protein Z954_0072 [Clostridium botulinum C/D str. BKT2873]QPW62117.1 hypothetical protein IG390_13755 [Clostridium botulinum]